MWPILSLYWLFVLFITMFIIAIIIIIMSCTIPYDMTIKDLMSLHLNTWWWEVEPQLLTKKYLLPKASKVLNVLTDLGKEISLISSLNETLWMCVAALPALSCLITLLHHTAHARTRCPQVHIKFIWQKKSNQLFQEKQISGYRP